MDTQISRRVRAQLLGEEDVTETAPQPPARAREDGRPKGPRRVRNPWYLPPETWYSKSAATDPGEGRGGGFPYADQILGGGQAGSGGGAGKASDEGEAGGDRPLTQRETDSLEIVQAYKQYMKGSRLPHFLQ
uniref:Uncharacterized protein n=1 Tax=Zooxanthella nutricula TaxID=1333877 RepID=A0A7S2NHD1_9DINO|mmetsp:Transcript_27176/g.81955  ORF Transcript_27176/g.81955 Transcript_27176/m.81955 type:complete len:132 (+) Transcript_27176:366-761(+)